jgi:hypothetical protein
MDHSTRPDQPELLEVRRRARARLEQLDRCLRIARCAERTMPLVRYYGPRPLRPVPLTDLLAEGPWAA